MEEDGWNRDLRYRGDGSPLPVSACEEQEEMYKKSMFKHNIAVKYTYSVQIDGSRHATIVAIKVLENQGHC